jgi:hypothetical protein
MIDLTTNLPLGLRGETKLTSLLRFEEKTKNFEYRIVKVAETMDSRQYDGLCR